MVTRVRGGVEMGMTVVKSARWCGDGYGGGEECEVVFDRPPPTRVRGGVEMGTAVVKSARWCGDGYGGGEEYEVVWRWVRRW